MKAVLCPVCHGSGIVAMNFYNRTSEQWTNAGGTETCRACGGIGYVVIPEEPLPIYIMPAVTCPSTWKYI